MLDFPDGLGKRTRRLVLSLLFLLPGSIAWEQTYQQKTTGCLVLNLNAEAIAINEEMIHFMHAKDLRKSASLLDMS